MRARKQDEVSEPTNVLEKRARDGEMETKRHPPMIVHVCATSVRFSVFCGCTACAWRKLPLRRSKRIVAQKLCDAGILICTDLHTQSLQFFKIPKSIQHSIRICDGLQNFADQI